MLVSFLFHLQKMFKSIAISHTCVFFNSSYNCVSCFVCVCVCVCVCVGVLLCICISIAILTPFRLFPYMIFHTKIFATNSSQICVFSENLIKYIPSLKNCDTTYKKRNKNFLKKICVITLMPSN